MVELLCFIIIVVLSFFTGRVFRQHYKKSNVANCLVMLVVMTMSTTVGIIIATWLPEMVFSTILSIIVSLLLTIILTFNLPVMIMIESFSMLFMGSMMGAMLRIMTTNNSLLSIIFFTFVFILSTVIAIALWNTKDYPLFRKAIPAYFLVLLTIVVCILIGSTLSEILISNPNSNSESRENHNH